MRIGFVGAGLMGSGMVRNLAAAGHEVYVYARTPEKAAGLAATTVPTVRDAANGADLLCVCVTDSPDVRAVVEDALLADTPPPVIVDLSTISPAVARALGDECRARGVAYCDCPVSGGPAGADAGTLAIMCGGGADALALAAPALDAMGDPAKRIHFGPVGSGLVAKLVNNLLVATITASTAEALAIGQRAGLDVRLLRECLLGATSASWQLENRFPAALDGNTAPGFTTTNLRKDLGHARELAGRPLPMGDVARALFDGVDGELDYSAVAHQFMSLPVE